MRIPCYQIVNMHATEERSLSVVSSSLPHALIVINLVISQLVLFQKQHNTEAQRWNISINAVLVLNLYSIQSSDYRYDNIHHRLASCFNIQIPSTDLFALNGRPVSLLFVVTILRYRVSLRLRWRLHGISIGLKVNKLNNSCIIYSKMLSENRCSQHLPTKRFISGLHFFFKTRK